MQQWHWQQFQLCSRLHSTIKWGNRSLLKPVHVGDFQNTAVHQGMTCEQTLPLTRLVLSVLTKSQLKIKPKNFDVHFHATLKPQYLYSKACRQIQQQAYLLPIAWGNKSSVESRRSLWCWGCLWCFGQSLRRAIDRLALSTRTQCWNSFNNGWHRQA